jgi:hypothetical protein
VEPDRFAAALRGLLQSQEDRANGASAGAGLGGWAPQHTATIDAMMAPGLALVDLALRRPVRSTANLSLPQAGRTRPIYRPLLAYTLARGTGQHPAPAEARDRADSTSAVGAMWALSLSAIGEGRDVFASLLSAQRATGEFLDASPYDSPDLHWYDELVLLHVLASHSALAGDESARSAIFRAAEFHTAETQPDHATTQPWALHAFGRHADTMPLADLLLHGALAQNSGRLDVISRILVADAVLGLA